MKKYLLLGAVLGFGAAVLSNRLFSPKVPVAEVPTAPVQARGVGMKPLFKPGVPVLDVAAFPGLEERLARHRFPMGGGNVALLGGTDGGGR